MESGLDKWEKDLSSRITLACFHMLMMYLGMIGNHSYDNIIDMPSSRTPSSISLPDLVLSRVSNWIQFFFSLLPKRNGRYRLHLLTLRYFIDETPSGHKIINFS